MTVGGGGCVSRPLDRSNYAHQHAVRNCSSLPPSSTRAHQELNFSTSPRQIAYSKLAGRWLRMTGSRKVQGSRTRCLDTLFTKFIYRPVLVSGRGENTYQDEGKNKYPASKRRIRFPDGTWERVWYCYRKLKILVELSFLVVFRYLTKRKREGTYIRGRRFVRQEKEGWNVKDEVLLATRIFHRTGLASKGRRNIEVEK